MSGGAAWTVVEGGHGEWHVEVAGRRVGEVRPGPGGWSAWWVGRDGVVRPCEIPPRWHAARDDAVAVVVRVAAAARRGPVRLDDGGRR